ncbi:GNAT family N-acetyltransferase [Ferrimonas kyonanensis]|uniref:GNAT family N-acetyltransferase n=1 Tax=Ferrimonas kyonanensis TaxID=364763 RepID=UPI0003F86E07|nr:GNAT family N-acetyltransferase [Ferrimonas kyonanensis]
MKTKRAAMELRVFDESQPQLVDTLRARIRDFNRQHWPEVTRKPLAVAVHSDDGELLGGASGSSFGHWLQLDWLWVDPAMQGQGLGQQLLVEFERQGHQRGCRWCLLDTLEFQAKPFYQKRGYQEVWQQQAYPLTGQRSYLVKTLVDDAVA